MKLPIECRARYNAIKKVASELVELFENGNRNNVKKVLLSYPKSEALAILAEIFQYAFGKSAQDDLTNYFIETA